MLSDDAGLLDPSRGGEEAREVTEAVRCFAGPGVSPSSPSQGTQRNESS